MKYVVNIGGRETEIEVDGPRVTVAGETHEAHLTSVAGTPLRHLTLDGEAALLALQDDGSGCWQVDYRGARVEVEVLDERTRHIRALVGTGRTEARGGQLKAPMPGLVVRLLVRPGTAVQSGDGVVVLEAMKMENELKAPAAGRVARILVEPGQAVDKGEILAEFEPEDGGNA